MRGVNPQPLFSSPVCDVTADINNVKLTSLYVSVGSFEVYQSFFQSRASGHCPVDVVSRTVLAECDVTVAL